MSIFSKLFGGGSKSDEPAKKSAKPETYKDFRIFPEPIRDGGQYRVAARIEKEVDGETKTHQLIRADTIGDADTAAEASLNKARQVIDEQGERLFN